MNIIIIIIIIIASLINRFRSLYYRYENTVSA